MLTICQATLAQLEDAAQLFDQYRQFYQQPAALEVSRAFIQERIDNNQSVIYLAYQQHEAVGFLQLYPTFSSISARSSWILNDLYVTPSARGLGIAKQLMDRARQLAVDTKAEGLTLQTQITNSTAQALYESLHYQRDNEFYTYCLVI